MSTITERTEQQMVDLYDNKVEETGSMRLSILIQKHRELDERADAMSAQLPHLSPRERTNLRELKVRRLHAKEAIERLRNLLTEESS